MLFFAIFFFRFDVAAWFMLAYWFVIQIAGGFDITEASQGGTAFFAHVGGFVTGVVLVHIMGVRERFSCRRDLSW
jgi:membrane associated rhomboid family serine protease